MADKTDPPIVARVIMRTKPDELKRLLEGFALLTDDIGKNMMKMLVSSKLYVDDQRSNDKNPRAAYRLDHFELMGLARSKMVRAPPGYVARKYVASKNGKTARLKTVRLRNASVRQYTITEAGRKAARALRFASIPDYGRFDHRTDDPVVLRTRVLKVSDRS